MAIPSALLFPTRIDSFITAADCSCHSPSFIPFFYYVVDAAAHTHKTKVAQLKVEINTLHDQLESAQNATVGADAVLQSSVTAQKEHITALKAALDTVS